MRRLLPVAAAAAVVAAVVIGLSQAGSGGSEETGRFELAEARRALAGAPAELAALHAQSAALLDGGAAAVRRRLSQLKGHPVVVNKWASWCGPCRIEFPHFQRQATKRGKQVAFLGLNAGDNRDDAQEFLREFPLPFPSYVDPDEAIARALGIARDFPTTAFFDARGRKAFVHIGQYRRESELAADIDRLTGA